MGLSLSEVLLIIVILIAVVKPEKLPEYVQQIKTTLGKAKESMADVKGELKETADAVNGAKEEFEKDAGIADIRSEVDDIKNNLRS